MLKNMMCMFCVLPLALVVVSCSHSESFPELASRGSVSQVINLPAPPAVEASSLPSLLTLLLVYLAGVSTALLGVWYYRRRKNLKLNGVS